ncbi:hypothetical protein [Plasmodium yoelii yoelii]|uniref:Uncharacterized protein n=1 Tax=Plasmodium yoelii yoelii TaxID=73239 RepID=Q7R6Z9_PLAYO|nr:hypothetical protein [Plasmodium yoelii yoelii]
MLVAATRTVERWIRSMRQGGGASATAPLRGSGEEWMATADQAVIRNRRRSQQILPGLALDARRVLRGMPAPLHGGSGLGLNLLGVEVGARLGLHHEDRGIGFGHEVGDVFRLLSAELVVDLELSLRGLEPPAGVAFEDDGEAALAVRVELLQRVQTLREPAEQHLADSAHVLHRFAEMARGLSRRRGVVAGLQFREAATDLHLELGRLLEEVRHHLGVDFPRDQAAIPIQHTDRLGFREVTLQMPHHLAREVVEQVGVGEVVDVVEVHQRVDDVVLRALLFQADFRRQRELLVGAQHLADDLALARL